jgi:Survival motor neuron (SMN) interacting protein 1 (SIP1)
MTVHLLMYFTHWINVHVQKPEDISSQISDTHARWMFALLSRVEDSISADDMSLLRNLARAVLDILKQRRSLPTDSVLAVNQPTVALISESSCWLVVSAVVGVWGQRDIWTDAEAMLVSLDR